jgi:glucosamine--fructose-6-phosphate aminotransferase (isomerizing)
MSLTVSEPFHFLEFRHGPISMLDRRTMVVGLVSEEQRSYEQAVLSDIKKHGGSTLTLSERQADIELDFGMYQLTFAVTPPTGPPAQPAR